jgi:hypothetical protein
MKFLKTNVELLLLKSNIIDFTVEDIDVERTPRAVLIELESQQLVKHAYEPLSLRHFNFPWQTGH